MRPGTLLAIDSGHPECAVAGCVGKRLVRVATVPVPPAPSAATPYADRVVVEIPQARPNTPDANDLIKIAVAGMRLAVWCAGHEGMITEYRPAEWKGNAPKPVHHARMWDRLLSAERELLGGAKTKAAIDAACLRGAKDRWQNKGASYYRARELPTVNGVKITHDILDASALALYALGRIPRG